MPDTARPPPRQLHLPLALDRVPSLAEYLPGPNAEAVAAVERAAAGNGEPYLLLVGPTGTGKSHLLQGACLAAKSRGRAAHYCPLGTAGMEPSLLDDLERLDLVALDELHRVAGDPDWERALFDLVNRLRERHRTLVAAADSPPDALPLGLPDLRSRLAWGPRYVLKPLSESDTEALLVRTARSHGLAFPDGATRLILTQYPRDPASLVALVARIDALCLAERSHPKLTLIRRAMLGEG